MDPQASPLQPPLTDLPTSPTPPPASQLDTATLRRRVLSVEQQNEFFQRFKDICNATPLAPASTELPSAVVCAELRDRRICIGLY
jgi:hypothetical protein